MTTIRASYVDLSALPFESFIAEMDRLYANKKLPVQGVHRGPAGLLVLTEWEKS